MNCIDKQSYIILNLHFYILIVFYLSNYVLVVFFQFHDRFPAYLVLWKLFIKNNSINKLFPYTLRHNSNTHFNILKMVLLNCFKFFIDNRIYFSPTGNAI